MNSSSSSACKKKSQLIDIALFPFASTLQQSMHVGKRQQRQEHENEQEDEDASGYHPDAASAGCTASNRCRASVAY